MDISATAVKFKMKNILILTYDFPPYVSVGGLQPYSWFQYLPEFDMFPVVVTRHWNNKYGNHLDYIAPSDSVNTNYVRSKKGLIIRTAYISNLSNKLMFKYGDSKFKLFRKSISAFYEFSQYLFLTGPKSNLYFEADNYLSKHKADIIIATGEPFVLFKYASKLSRKYNIPWIADYRDPWTQSKIRRNVGIPKIWDAFLEKKILSNVSVVTTVSKYLEKKISGLISDKPFHIISNGYDPDAISKASGICQTDKKLSIAIGGTIYKWHPIESFLSVVSDFIRTKKPRIEINFYGINIESEIRNLIETKYQNLKSVVKIHPKISNEHYNEKLAANNVFLLFNDYTIMGTKIYSFLALKRRIILCYGNDNEAKMLKKKYYNIEDSDFGVENLQEKVISETNSGIVIEDKNHLMTVLNDLYSEFETDGFIVCDSVNTEKYSRRIQVGNLVKVIEKTLAIRKEKQP